jgi:CubicO group peptidase (beta-lactamase class C family)
MRWVIAAAMLFIAWSMLAMANATDVTDPWPPVVAKLQGEYPSNGPGAYAIVAQGDSVLFSRGFGVADIEHDVPWAADGVVRIASLTKQFTATAVLQLVESGKLKLDDRLGDVLPDCPPAWRVISLRELLNQTSGLTDDLSPLMARLTSDLTPDQILALYRDQPLLSAPGSQWRYSNLNYWILGRIIELHGGQPYADYIRRHVLTSAMTRTRYGSNDAIIPGRVRGYEPAADGSWSNARYFSATLGYAAGGFISTPADMAQWYAALSRGDVLSPAMRALALTPGTTLDGKPTGYGFGWYVSQEHGILVARHGGSTFGFQSSIAWIPSCALFAGVFKNTNDTRGEPDSDVQMLLAAVINRCRAERAR